MAVKHLLQAGDVRVVDGCKLPKEYRAVQSLDDQSGARAEIW